MRRGANGKRNVAGWGKVREGIFYLRGSHFSLSEASLHVGAYFATPAFYDVSHLSLS
jgi:hypothetical protein